jgi:hypothetical protein
VGGGRRSSCSASLRTSLTDCAGVRQGLLAFCICCLAWEADEFAYMGTTSAT